MNLKSFGKFLIELRKEKGLTQQEVADSIFVNVKTISKWETCRGYPDVETFPLIANYFGISVDELINCKKADRTLEENKIEKLQVINHEQRKEIENYKAKIHKKEAVIWFTVILIISLIILGSLLIIFAKMSNDANKSLIGTQIHFESNNFTYDTISPYSYTTLYDGKTKQFDAKIYTTKDEKLLTVDDYGRDVLEFSYTCGNDNTITKIVKKEDFPKEVGEYNIYIAFSPTAKYAKNSITIKLSIRYSTTDLSLSRNKDNTILSDKLAEIIEYKANSTGTYLFSTKGTAKTTIRSDLGEVSNNNNYSTCLNVELQKDETLSFLISKNSRLGNVSLAIQFIPEEIQKEDRKSFELTPKEEKHFIYYASSIENSFDYHLQSDNTVNFNIVISNYYNFSVSSFTEANITDTLLNGSVLIKPYYKVYYLIITNRSNTESCSVELLLKNIDNINFDFPSHTPDTLVAEKQLNFMLNKLITFTSPYDIEFRCRTNSSFRIATYLYDSKYNERSLNYDYDSIFVEKNKVYYLLLDNKGISENSVTISVIPPVINYGTTDIKTKNFYNFMQYKHEKVSGDYNIKTDINIEVFDKNFNPLSANDNGSYNFLIDNTYYILANLENKRDYKIEIEIDYTQNLSGNFSATGKKFIIFTPAKTASYLVNGVTGYTWRTFDYLLNANNFLYADRSYILEIAGEPLSSYNIQLTLLRPEIVLDRNTGRKSGYYKFIAPKDGVYSFRTNVTSTNISALSLYDQNDNMIFENICTDITPRNIYLTAGTYHITLNGKDKEASIFLTISLATSQD